MFVLGARGRGVDCIKADSSGASADARTERDQFFGGPCSREKSPYIKRRWWSHLCLSIHATTCQGPKRKMKGFERHEFLSRQQNRSLRPLSSGVRTRCGQDSIYRLHGWLLVNGASRLNRPGGTKALFWDWVMRVTTSLPSMKPRCNSGHLRAVSSSICSINTFGVW